MTDGDARESMIVRLGIYNWRASGCQPLENTRTEEHPKDK